MPTIFNYASYGSGSGGTGAKGDKGDQGVAGTTGAKGDQGLQGLQGLPGTNGTTGAKGDKGDQGIQGLQGVPGTNGSGGGGTVTNLTQSIPADSSNPLVLSGTFLHTAYATATLTSSRSLTFNKTGAVPGASNYLRFVGNGQGANIITMGTNCKLVAGSDVFDSTNGVVNLVQTLYDGVDNWVTFITEQPGSNDTVAPVFVSATFTLPNIIELTYNEPLRTAQIPVTSFTLSGGKAVSTAIVTGSKVVLNSSTNYVAGDLVTVAYAVPGTNPLADVANNPALALAAVTLPNPTQGLPFIKDNSSTPNIVYSRSAAAPYIFSVTGSGVNNTNFFNTMVIGNGAPGDFEVVLKPVNGAPVPVLNVGFNTVATSSDGVNIPNSGYVIYSSPNLSAALGTQSPPAGVDLPGTNLDWIRMKRVSNIITRESSQDNGVTWVAWTGAGSNYPGTVYMHMVFRDGNGQMEISVFNGFNP